MFYIENKSEISEDLLSDFKDPDNEAKFVKPAVFGKTKGIIDTSKIKEANVIVKSDTLASEHEYLFG